MMILIATVTILLTMVLITVVYYDLFRRQVLEDLKSYGSLLKSCSSVEEIKENDYNLNIPRYVDTFEEEGEIDLAEVQKLIDQDEKEIAELEKVIAGQLKLLGV